MSMRVDGGNNLPPFNNNTHHTSNQNTLNNNNSLRAVAFEESSFFVNLFRVIPIEMSSHLWQMHFALYHKRKEAFRLLSRRVIRKEKNSEVSAHHKNDKTYDQNYRHDDLNYY